MYIYSSVASLFPLLRVRVRTIPAELSDTQNPVDRRSSLPTGDVVPDGLRVDAPGLQPWRIHQESGWDSV